MDACDQGSEFRPSSQLLPPRLGWGRSARLPSPGFDYNPLVYGHVNERIPFFIFGHEFVERESLPECIWHGHHANMNCTQPVVEHQPRQQHADGEQHAGGGGGRHANASGLPKPSVAWGCKPFDRSCGTAG